MGIFKRFISRRKEDLNKKETKREELFLKIRGIITTELEIGDKEKITPDSRLIDDFNMDSLNTIELVMALEEEFGIDIPDEDAEKTLTVKDIVDYIENKISGT